MTSDLEMELETEFESECEYGNELELEDEFEDEFEGEEFLGDAWRWLTKPQSKQRKVALSAAKAALKGGGTAGGAALGALAGGAGAPVGGVLGGTVGAGLASLLPDEEFEDASTCAGRGSVNAAMEHFGDMACRARSNAEAEAFLGALIPLVGKLVPQAAAVVRRAAPRLIRGVGSVARTLRSSPVTRGLVKSVPTIVKRTAADVAKQVAQGKPVTPKGAVRTLAKQTARTLGRPDACQAALRRCTQLNRAYVARLKALQARR